MTPEEKQLNMLGLAQRAGRLISGDEFVTEAIRNDSVRLVILANDASPRTTKKFITKCHNKDIPLNRDYSKIDISQAIGKSRTIIAMTDMGMAKKFLSYRDSQAESEEYHV